MRKRENGFHGVFGVELPRVTSILSRLARWGLDEWQATCAVDFLMSEFVLPLQKGWMTIDQLKDMDPDRLRKSAMVEAEKRVKLKQTIGRRVHKVIHDYYSGGQHRDFIEQVVRGEKDLELALRAHLKWEEDYQVELVHSERPVFSFVKKYSGTTDLQANLTFPEDGRKRLFIVDFKTGAPDPKDAIQIAAYTVAVEEMDQRPIDGAGLVYLDQDTGKPRWKGYDRNRLMVPFLMFEKIKAFVDLENEWRGRDVDFKEGPPATPTPPSPDPSREQPPAGPFSFTDEGEDEAP